MKIYVTDRAGNLKEVEGGSVVIKLSDGETLEFSGFEHPNRPPAVMVWGGRMPREPYDDTFRAQSRQLNLTPSAGNCIDIRPIKREE